ncbi:MAG: glycosyltransferase family 4 protein [Vicingus serpentipes]|nr:glycosyltransferase family 4 protein [Vicingus serpentipes]
MKKIAVNTRLLLKGKMDGIGLFTYETFRIIVEQHPEIEFVFIFDRTPHPDFINQKNVSFKVLSPPTRHIYLFKYWYQVALKKLLKKIAPDIFIGSDGMIPLNATTKTLAIIHDLNFEHHPEHLPKNVFNYYKKWFPLFAEKANRIATVSEFSKTDITKTYSIAPSKIDVVYNGANKNFKPVTIEEAPIIQNKYTEGNPYFLFVGTLHPRKNLINLFRAFDQFKTKTQSSFKLLVVGKKMWWTKEMETAYNNLNHQTSIIFTDRVDKQELYQITASAYALTYVPIFEGFGIPLVEAMSCGVPIITSNVTSMPEVVEDAALLVDPFSINDITDAMIKIATDENLRNKLSEKSIQQAKKFSWEKTADLLWQSILKTIDA